MDPGDSATTILIGVLSSIVASWAFLLLLLSIRPRIRIAPRMAISKNRDGRREYQLKVLNRSWFPALEIKARLFLVNRANEIMEHEPIPLKMDHLPILKGYRLRDEPEAYAWRFVTYEDLDERWRESIRDHLLIQITATHWLTGFSRVFEQRYRGKDRAFCVGEYRLGRDLSIDPVQNRAA